MKMQFCQSRKVYAVAMSGGVDSSATAAILKNEGHDVFGITMLLHEFSKSSIENAKKVCEKLKIQHFILDARAEFKKYVMDVFADYYSNGLTPNPCAFCNRDIKLNLLLNFAKEKGADLMATGHYACLEIKHDNDVILSEAVNKSKDQSYFLSLVSKDNLKYVRFPLGKIYAKSETRKIAESFGLHNFEKKDSQDICFIQDNYKEFLKSNYSESNLFKQGDIKLINTEKILGKHNGIVNYTIGQRKGLGISHESPLYVVNLDSKQNDVIVGSKEALERPCFNIHNTNWLLDYPDVFEGYAKLRSVAKKVKARIEKITEGTLINLLEISQTPVTNGQICAIYNSINEIIGAGIIG